MNEFAHPSSISISRYPPRIRFGWTGSASQESSCTALRPKQCRIVAASLSSSLFRSPSSTGLYFSSLLACRFGSFRNIHNISIFGTFSRNCSPLELLFKKGNSTWTLSQSIFFNLMSIIKS